MPAISQIFFTHAACLPCRHRQARAWGSASGTGVSPPLLKFRYKAVSLVPTPRELASWVKEIEPENIVLPIFPPPPPAPVTGARRGRGGRECGWLGLPILFTHEASSWGSQNLISEFQPYPNPAAGKFRRVKWACGNKIR